MTVNSLGEWPTSTVPRGSERPGVSHVIAARMYDHAANSVWLGRRHEDAAGAVKPHRARAQVGASDVPIPTVLVVMLRAWVDQNNLTNPDALLFRTRNDTHPSGSNWIRA